MIRTFVGSAVAVVALTLVLGFAYPLVMTGFAQVAFNHQANGSLIERNGTVVGSKLAAQAFTKPQYFHPRPSAADGNRFTAGNNRPNSSSTIFGSSML